MKSSVIYAVYIVDTLNYTISEEIDEKTAVTDPGVQPADCLYYQPHGAPPTHAGVAGVGDCGIEEGLPEYCQ